MRAGGSSLHQALTPEACSIVKQSVLLAKRRGHAQVTPLHVASTMLSSSTGLFRTACAQSHPHPLQCKALELCFNVALNRLPSAAAAAAAATTAVGNSPHFHHHLHPYHPSLSNALVAAFKRAQAHQRRGSIENQQQPLLAVKVEVEQLIVSILDDPSVSRVMREAGFSSTQVKNNVEIAISLDNRTNSSLSKPKETNLCAPVLNSSFKSHSFSGLEHAKNEDVVCLVETLLRRRRKSTVIVGECLITAEGVVRELMGRIEKGEVPDELNAVQFLTFPLFTFGHLCKEDVDRRLGELRCLLKRYMERGAILYVGDLKWAAEFRESYSCERRKYFCPVEYVVFEIGRLVSDFVETGRFWLLAISSYQTFMRCKTGHPSLEALWGLHPLTIPSGSLALSLNSDSGRSHEGSFEKPLTCCAECLSKFDLDVQGLARTTSGPSTSSNLPLWLQRCKDENKDVSSNDCLDQFQVTELCRKWNGICNSSHKPQLQAQSETTMSFLISWNKNDQAPVNHSLEQHAFGTSKAETIFLDLPGSDCSSPNSNPFTDMRFNQFNAEGLKSLCTALEQKAAWQKDIIPEIASVLLQCRSGMLRRKSTRTKEKKEDTCLLFEGTDTEGKEIVARELANQIFCSENSFTSIGLSCFSSFGAESTDGLRGKRSREESGSNYFEKFCEAIHFNPHRVIFLEDIEQVDYHTLAKIMESIERGKVTCPDGDEVSLRDAIIILSCEKLKCTSRDCSPSVKQKMGTNDEMDEEKSSSEKEEASPYFPLDLNLSAEDNESVEMCCEVELEKCVDRSFVFHREKDEQYVP
ncbi:protein SMAX1-LIKE 3-like isoform X1 [Nymphaea colorata]|nr:protein SMAX1-LIKE 3-like isoform X1 [Nymphaea colorata]